MEDNDLSHREIARLAYLAKAMFSRPDMVEQLVHAALNGPVPAFDSKRFKAVVHAMSRLVVEAGQNPRSQHENFIRAILQNVEDRGFDPSASPQIIAASFLQNAAREQASEQVAALGC